MLRPYLQPVPEHVQHKTVAAADQELNGFFHMSQGICDRQEIFLVVGPGAFTEGLAGHWEIMGDVFQDISG